MAGKAVRIEQDVEIIKNSIQCLKKKDQEILEILLETKLLLDRQKIEDIKLSVLEDDQVEEEESDILAEKLQEKSDQMVQLQSSIRSEFMNIISRNSSQMGFKA